MIRQQISSPVKKKLIFMVPMFMHMQRVSRPESFLTHWTVEAQSLKMSLNVVFHVLFHVLCPIRILSTNLA